MIVLFSKGCPSPLPLPSLRRRRPRGRAVPPCTGAAPVGATALAGSSPGYGATPFGLAASSHPLRPGRGHCLCLQVAAHAGSCPCKGLWSWPAAPTKDLAVAGHPLSLLPLLRKCSNNA
ncbi:hypothetical protein GW17_00024653 [Ensete ventricosum]|nr:hypothetical protein GW17_00024653 [Ensete ventricosum]